MPACDVVSADPDAPATTLLAAVTSGVSVVREPRLARARFEEQLRMLVNARSVAVRECAAETKPHPDALSFDVPTGRWTVPARLEAVFDPARAVSDREHRTLEVGAQLASLLVQIEYASGRWGRFRSSDGAVPLIGSSAAIRRVRERIERVAGTDFTILIEGPSRR